MKFFTSLALASAIALSVGYAHAGDMAPTSVTPADNSTIESLDVTVQFQFDGDIELAYKYWYMDISVTDGSTTWFPYKWKGYAIDGNTLNVTLSSTEMTSVTGATYTITLDEDIVERSSDNEGNAEITVSYTLAEAEDTFLVPESASPATGSYTLSELNDTYYNSAKIFFPYSEGKLTVNKKAMINNASGDWTECDTSFSDVLYSYSNQCAIMVDLPSSFFTEDGIYTLTLPRGAVSNASGTINEAYSIYYTISGASSSAAAEYKVVSVSPAEGSELAAFNEGDKLELTLNTTEGINYLEIKLYEDGEYVYGFDYDTSVTVSGNAITLVNKAYDITFYDGKKYEFVYSFYDARQSNIRKEVGSVTVYYVGTSAGAVVFSDITVDADDFDPAPGSFITAADNTVTINFSGYAEFVSGYVTEGGQLASTAQVTATGSNYNNTWTITIPSSFVSSNTGGFTMILSFVDAYERPIIPSVETGLLYPYYDTATGFRTSIAANYECMEGGDTVEVTPAAGQVSELYELTFSYKGGIGWGSAAYNQVQVLNSNSEVVAYVASVQTEGDINGWNETVDKADSYLIATLNTKVTADGSYTLVIPYTALTLGTDENAVGYKGQTVEYVIGTSGISSAIAAEAEATYYDLQGIQVANPVVGKVYIRVQDGKAAKVIR